MGEDFYVMRDRKINYAGYFNVSELYYIIDNYIHRMGYDKQEDKHDVRVFKTHRDIELKLTPNRTMSDYLKYVLVIDIGFFDLKDVVLQDGPNKKTVQEGRIKMNISAVRVTNQNMQWESKPWPYLMRTLIDKFIYKGYMDESNSELKAHCEGLVHEISAYLNTTKIALSNTSAPVTRKAPSNAAH